MFGLLLLLLLAVPFVELWVIIEVWRTIGGLETMALLLGISVVGAWLVRREGMSVWTRFNEQMASGSVPAAEIVDGALILFAGALLLTPGFVTDGVALALLFPPVRAGLRALVRKRLTKRVERSGPVRVIRFGTGRAGFGDPLGDAFGGGPPGRDLGDDVVDVSGEERSDGSGRRRSSGELDG